MTTTHTPPMVQHASPEDGARLLDQVRAAVRRYVILPDEHAEVGVTLWIAATHAVPAWAHAARLVIRAPEKRCGKSRLLDLVEAMCHHPLITVNISSSALYRSVGMTPTDPPTLLIDEADAIFGPKAQGDGAEDLRGLLNAGHGRNRPALRYDAGSRQVEKIDTFAMAALAGIGQMPDTIEDRAVVVRMRRRAPGERVAPFRVRRDRPALDQLRAALHLWARDNIVTLGAAVPAMPVEDRAADTWEPLVAVADLAGTHWPAQARHAAVALTTDREATAQQSVPTRLLTDCRTVWADADALPTADLLDRLKADPEAPWATWGGVGLTSHKLGAMLREFDITSRNMRFSAGQAKGYARADFTDAWARYCPPEASPSPPAQPPLWSEVSEKSRPGSRG